MNVELPACVVRKASWTGQDWSCSEENGFHVEVAGLAYRVLLVRDAWGWGSPKRGSSGSLACQAPMAPSSLGSGKPLQVFGQENVIMTMMIIMMTPIIACVSCFYSSSPKVPFSGKLGVLHRCYLINH